MTQSDERALISSAKTEADAARTLATAIETAMKAAAFAWEYDYTISQSLAVSLSLTNRVFVAPAADAKVGDLVIIYPRGRPTVGGVNIGGYILQATSSVFNKGSVDVNAILPAISVAGALSMPIKMRGFRPPATT